MVSDSEHHCILSWLNLNVLATARYTILPSIVCSQMAERYPIIGDVRGSGLFLGIELVRDRETLEPATEEASFIADQMREHGILLGTDGPFHNVLKIRPPMPFDEENADFLVATLDKILSENFGKYSNKRM